MLFVKGVGWGRVTSEGKKNIESYQKEKKRR